MSFIRNAVVSLVLTAPVMSAGCVSEPCTGNPLTDSAHCAARAIGDGTYDWRIATLRDAADAERTAASAGKAGAGALSADLATYKIRRQRYERELEQLGRQINLLSAQLGKDSQQIAELRRLNALLKLDLSSLPPDDPDRAAKKEADMLEGIAKLKELCDEISAGRIVD